jgi:hypothetical protein
MQRIGRDGLQLLDSEVNFSFRVQE